jgi:tetratricopeptide (TPR) repeat protein
LLKRVRPLDAAIAVVAIAILAIGAYLAYSMWSNSGNISASSPATREINAALAKLKKTPNDVETRMRLAQALSVAGRSTEAVKQYQQVLKVSKDWVPALAGIGFELMKEKDWKGGETYFKKVISLTENKTPAVSGESSLEIAYYYTGVARMEQRDYAGAAGYLKSALRLRRDASDTAYALAVCYRNLGEDEGYRDMLAYTLQFDPKAPEANYEYGQLLVADGDVASGAEHLRISADAAPYKAEPREALDKLGTPEARIASAEKLASTDASAALDQVRVAVALDKQSVDALLLMGKLNERLRHPDVAQTTYQKVLAIEPGNAEAAAGLKRVKNGS